MVTQLRNIHGRLLFILRPRCESVRAAGRVGEEFEDGNYSCRTRAGFWVGAGRERGVEAGTRHGLLA